MARFGFGVPLIVFLVSVGTAHNPPQSNPQAVTFAYQSIVTLTGGNAISDVTLTGSVTWSSTGRSRDRCNHAARVRHRPKPGERAIGPGL
jgi:hypothetical protein